MSKVDEQCSFLRDAARLILWCETNNLTTTGGELFRTIEQQQWYWDHKMTKTMKSKHLEKLAIDLFLIVDGRMATLDEYRPMGDYWKSLHPHNVWGGDWGWDANHFQRSA